MERNPAVRVSAFLTVNAIGNVPTWDIIDHYGMGVRNRIINSIRRHNGTEPDLVEEDDRFMVRLWKAPRMICKCVGYPQAILRALRALQRGRLDLFGLNTGKAPDSGISPRSGAQPGKLRTANAFSGDGIPDR